MSKRSEVPGEDERLSEPRGGEGMLETTFLMQQWAICTIFGCQPVSKEFHRVEGTEWEKLYGRCCRCGSKQPQGGFYGTGIIEELTKE